MKGCSLGNRWHVPLPAEDPDAADPRDWPTSNWPNEYAARFPLALTARRVEALRCVKGQRRGRRFDLSARRRSL
jgi:hypothetical protein